MLQIQKERDTEKQTDEKERGGERRKRLLLYLKTFIPSFMSHVVRGIIENSQLETI